jgi:hypothetical protein
MQLTSETADSRAAYLQQLRALRSRAVVLRQHLKEDFRGFLADDRLTFVWEPSRRKGQVSAATTCTGLIALASTQSLSNFYDGDDTGFPSSVKAFKRVMAAAWTSSDLPEDNPFTTILVIRTAGILAAAGAAPCSTLLDMKRTAHGRWAGKTLRQIIQTVLRGFPDSLEIQRYPPTPAVAYWLLEGLAMLHYAPTRRQLQKIAEWTRDRFVREVSLISADHDALMDPIALAMSAALAWLLKGPQKPGGAERILATLPTALEISYGVRAFLDEQLDSGLWPKYFPLFHFPGPEAGANYCWSFEVLEALLLEMLPQCGVLDVAALLKPLDRSLSWCQHNRLILNLQPPHGQTIAGWNSGGQIRTLQEGRPELWATAVVHMYAYRAETLLSALIQKELERKYDAAAPIEKDDRWSGILDFDLEMIGETTPTSVKTEIDVRMIAPILAGTEPLSRSALLFGPPGTSKTSVVKAVAQRVNWTYIELSPSDFLRDGLPNIYGVANEIFDDLKDLRDVVVLFDEMDALARNREDDTADDHPLDITQQFLTTSMLPKLAQLHDQRDLLFFMATNFQGRFDAAIKRPGRFDLLLLLGPPSWQRKLGDIGQFWKRARGRKVTDAKLTALRGLLEQWAPPGGPVAKQLDAFTFGEMLAFLKSTMSDADELEDDLLRAFRRRGARAAFLKKVETWYEVYITLRPTNSPAVTRYQNDQKVSRRQ